MYDLAIIGGGPAGVSAGIYAARKKLKTIFIADKFTGQSVVSPDIQNWIGTPSISGIELAKNMENHLKTYADGIVDIKEGEKVENISEIKPTKSEHSNIPRNVGMFEIQTNKDSYTAEAVLVATGSHRRRLQAKGVDALEHKGITYCATCDGPFFTDKDVVVIGGGNSGFESASQLSAYTKSVTIIHRSEKLRADEITVTKVSENPKVKIILNAVIKEILGENSVTGLIYEDTKTGETHEIKIEGVFVEIGSEPTTSFVTDLVDLNDYKSIIVDPKTQKTSKEGVWAAGDCTDGLYHQNNIAVGDAVKALEDIYLYLKTK